MRVDFISDDECRLELLSEFYSREVVDEVLGDYSEFLRSEIELAEGYFVLKLVRLDRDYFLEILVNELLNYFVEVSYVG